MQVGVYGIGFVGGATADVLEQAHTVHRYDAFYDPERHEEPYNTDSSLEELTSLSDVVFFCLPTPMQPGGKIDYTPMHDSFKTFVGELERIGRPRDDVVGVIRSTAVSGTTDGFSQQYGLRLTFNPEFLREKTALEDMQSTDRVVIGSNDERDGLLVERVYRELFPSAKYHHMDTEEAEMVKYMANVMLLGQVALANQLYTLCEAGGLDYDRIKEVVLGDNRIGRNLDVPGPDGDFGFGGKCFPKDLNALRTWAREHGVEPWLLDAVWKLNLDVRSDHDWLNIPGATSENRDFGTS